MNTIEGKLTAPSDAKFALVASRFNDFIVNQLVAGAKDTLVRHGVFEAQLSLTWVPGAWELGPVCQRLAASKQFDAIVALGAVIRGGTPHFDFVAGGAAKALGQVFQETGVPVGFGVLTTDTIEQAIERAGTKAGNKGAEAALAALEMVNLNRELAHHGL